MEKNIQFYRTNLLREMHENQMCQECGGLMERGMCTECGWMEEALVGGQKKLDVAEPKGELTAADFKALRSQKKEGADHEVSMASSSLEQIISAAQELLAKLGDNERDIPGWIQDHITNAENYIHQAAKGFHELHGMDNAEQSTEEMPVEEDLFLESIIKKMIVKDTKSKK